MVKVRVGVRSNGYTIHRLNRFIINFKIRLELGLGLGLGLEVMDVLFTDLIDFL
jgi:hypothetical protein